MDLRQKLTDLYVLLKEDRKSQVIAGVILFFLLWGLMAEPPPQRRVAQDQTEEDLGTGGMGAEEAYRDLITRFGKDLTAIREQTVSNAEKNEALSRTIEQYEERTAEIFKKMIERMVEIESSQAAGAGGPIGPVDVPVSEIGDLPSDGLEGFGEIDEVEVAPPAVPSIERIAFIGAGDSVRIKLLAGVNAPTDGTPYPVVFKLVDEVAGPDGSSLPLGEARLIAAAQGSLTDHRALFRLTSLNIRYPDGSRNIVDVDGWVVGEDGIRGMEGILVDPIGKALFGSLLSGTVEGVGEGIAFSQVFTGVRDDGSSFSFVNGDVAEYAIGRGLGKAGGRWGSFIDERAALLVPHVKILSGRKATAVFSQSIELEGLFDALSEQEYAFVSLD